MNIAGRSVAIAVIGTLLWAACGSDDSGDDPIALCNQGCAKIRSLCLADAGGTFECNCTPTDGGGGGGGPTCTNQDAINAAYKACLEKNTCEELLACKVPKCERVGAGGAGGAGGGGGTGGSGATDAGTSGTCADLLACCNRASSDQIKSACIMGYNTAMQQGDAACGAIYGALKATVCP
jgi:hypothetical protein